MRKTPLQGAAEPIAALNRVKITERRLPLHEREPLVDMRVVCPDVAMTDTICPFLRARVAEMLNRAQASLPAGYRLRAHTALRTLAMQKRGWDAYYRKMQEEHPQWPLSALRRATNRYFAPYDQNAPPGHCTGGAVDVKLLDPQGEELDLISPTTGWEAAYTWSDKISPEAKRNRLMMAEAMLGAGFSNCREEYWHYSWGDSAWAVRVGEIECPYDWIYPPLELQSDCKALDSARLSLSYETDEKGRVVAGAGDFEMPEGAQEWRIVLLWASGVPVSVRLRLPDSAAPTPSLFFCESQENAQPLEPAQRDGREVLLQITPQTDRFYLANFAPPVTSSETSAK